MIVPVRTSGALKLLVGAVFVISCGTTQTSTSSNAPAKPLLESRPALPPEVRVVFREGQAFAREGAREWPISEVHRDEMLWAPDGTRFAFLKLMPREPADVSSLLKGKASKGKAKKKRRGKPAKLLDAYHLVVRNIRGDPVNEFPIYRPGKPAELDWIDDQRIGYLAPPDDTGDAYVMHQVKTGEIMEILRGTRFVWSPGRKQLAYVTGKKNRDEIKVAGQTIWPRITAGRGKRKILGELAWSPDGSGLAFKEISGKQKNLVVLLVIDNPQGDLTWPLPRAALKSEHHLYWGKSKVIIGTSALKPSFAANWKRIQ